MLNEKVLGAAIVVTSDGASLESNLNPFYPRHTVQGVFEVEGFTGTSLIEGSDTGLFAGEEVTLLTSGAVTTKDGLVTGDVILKKFMRHSTTRSAGEVTIKLVSGM